MTTFVSRETPPSPGWVRALLSRHALSLSIAAALLAACGGSQPLVIAPSAGSDNGNAVTRHHKFEYTGAEQSFIVPSGVTSITVVALGAGGAGEASGSKYVPGNGGRVYAVIPVQAGETLYVFVGGEGAIGRSYRGGTGGFNGGGGGGGATILNGGGGGGGGSSYVESNATDVQMWQGWQYATGNGLVVFKW